MQNFAPKEEAGGFWDAAGEFIEYGTVTSQGLAVGFGIDIAGEMAADYAGDRFAGASAKQLNPTMYKEALARYARPGMGAKGMSTAGAAARYTTAVELGGMSHGMAASSTKTGWLQGTGRQLGSKLSTAGQYLSKITGGGGVGPTVVNKISAYGAGSRVLGTAFHGVSAVFAASAVQDLTQLGMMLAGTIDPGGMMEEVGKMHVKQQERQQIFGVMGSNFIDNKHAATMRQRSLSAIHNTQMNLTQVFGQEATHAHI